MASSTDCDAEEDVCYPLHVDYCGGECYAVDPPSAVDP